MKVLRGQHGIAFLGLLILLVPVIFLASVGIRVLPLYAENGLINRSLDTLSTTVGMGSKGKKQMIKWLDAQFYINGVTSIEGKDITFEKGRKVWVVSVDYEVRTVLLRNVGLYIDFKKSVEVPR